MSHDTEATETTSAHDLLSSALSAHIETVRKTTARVVASGTGRRVLSAGAKTAATSEAPSDTAPADVDPEEAVHDFRVALRRLRTALTPAREIYGKKRIRAISKGLKRYADITSALRDEEVLRQTLASLELPETARHVLDGWITRRARQERACRADVVRLLRHEELGMQVGDAPRLEQCLRRLEKRLDRPKDRETSAVALGRRAIGKARADIRELGEVNAADSAGMHALRIRYKRLRYTAELFSQAFGDEGPRIAKEASRLQTRLGDLHDIDEALVRIARARALGAPVQAAVIEALKTARVHMVERCRKELVAASTPKSSAETDESAPTSSTS